ncbi:MAG: sigma-70 family RNA polymerase sigma factor [Phycisphaerales bacterium]|nr:sigma-70 family RNA polymerase sigma factor [Phycisphaerales bacterium]
MDTTRPSLLLRLRDRSDGSAWAVFDEIYRPMLFRFAQLRGLNHADAEDITQQCMATISARIQQFEYQPTKGHFKGWLRTMVNNRVHNLYRERMRQHAATARMPPSERDEPTPEAVFDRLWQEEHLRHCLRELRTEVAESTFAAFEAHVIQQQPVAEVCARWGLTSANVYTIKWRLTERVAAKMKELLGDDG